MVPLLLLITNVEPPTIVARYTSMSPTSSNEYLTLKDLGNERFKNKDFEGAKRYYTEAIAVKDDDAVAYSNRAACYINLMDYYHVLIDCNRAIELDPQMSKAYYRRAVALRELSCLNFALADFKKVLSLDPDNKGVKEEIKKLEDIFRNNTRVDVKCHDKPEQYQSKNAMQWFNFDNQYSGTKQYKL